jgi:hypothetical protein
MLNFEWGIVNREFRIGYPRMTTHLPVRYQKNAEVAGIVSDRICRVLSNRNVDWEQFGTTEWQLLPEMAQIEGVGPLLYWHFSNKSDWPPGIPTEVAAALMGQYYVTLERNTLLFQELDNVLTAFEQANIPVILLKGAALAQTVYAELAQQRGLSATSESVSKLRRMDRNPILPNKGFDMALRAYSTDLEALALRPMGDLDLLVRRDDLDRASALAESLAFQHDTQELRSGLNRVVGHHVNLKKGENILLELHWSLIGGDYDRNSPPIEWAWQQTKQFQINELVVQSLNHPAHLLYLSAHLALQHGFAEARLIWFYDVYTILQSQEHEFDWSRLLAQGRELGWITSLVETLLSVAAYFEYPIPQDFINEIEKDPPGDANDVHRKANELTRTEYVSTRLGSLHGMNKVKLALAYLFPSPARMRYRYRPNWAWLWPLYYPYRWGDIIQDMIRTFWGRLKPGN